jgi:hypothetical protein
MDSFQWLDLRESRLAFEVFLLGTAMITPPYHRSTVARATRAAAFPYHPFPSLAGALRRIQLHRNRAQTAASSLKRL